MLSRKQLWRRCNLNLKRIDNTDIKEEEEEHDDEFNLKLKKREVFFQPVVRVILVPHFLDYEKSGAATKMWYSRDEYQEFYTKYKHLGINSSKYNSI